MSSEQIARLLGQLLIPLIFILAITSKSQRGDKRNVIIVAVLAVFFAIIFSSLGIITGIGCIVIGLIGIILIYTKEELPEKDEPKTDTNQKSCKKCGAEHAEGTKFCGHCGTRTENI